MNLRLIVPSGTYLSGQQASVVTLFSCVSYASFRQAPLAALCRSPVRWFGWRMTNPCNFGDGNSVPGLRGLASWEAKGGMGLSRRRGRGAPQAPCREKATLPQYRLWLKACQRVCPAVTTTKACLPHILRTTRAKSSERLGVRNLARYLTYRPLSRTSSANLCILRRHRFCRP